MITRDTIKHIAKLAKLKLEEDELDKFEKEFDAILGYIEQIKEVDTSDVKEEHNLQDYSGTILQPDIVKASLSREKAMQNATEGRSKNGYIRVSKIVNKE